MIKKIFPWVLIAAVVYSCVVVFLPWFRNYLFQGDIEEIIREVGYQSLGRARDRALVSARQNSVPVDEGNLVTTRDETTGLVTIEAQYTVTVKLGGEVYTKVWRFHPKATRVVNLPPGSGIF